MSTPEEVEEVFAGNHKLRRAGQRGYIALGETLDGLLAFVVVTARDMEDRERRLFRRK